MIKDKKKKESAGAGFFPPMVLQIKGKPLTMFDPGYFEALCTKGIILFHLQAQDGESLGACRTGRSAERKK